MILKHWVMDITIEEKVASFIAFLLHPFASQFVIVHSVFLRTATK